MVEILTGLLVVGALSATALPSYMQSVHKGRQGTANQNARMIAEAIQGLYVAKGGTFYFAPGIDARKISAELGGWPFHPRTGASTVARYRIRREKTFAIVQAKAGKTCREADLAAYILGKPFRSR
jgi:type II secretory pathway pseudopilin PulG